MVVGNTLLCGGKDGPNMDTDIECARCFRTDTDLVQVIPDLEDFVNEDVEKFQRIYEGLLVGLEGSEDTNFVCMKKDRVKADGNLNILTFDETERIYCTVLYFFN